VKRKEKHCRIKTIVGNRSDQYHTSGNLLPERDSALRPVAVDSTKSSSSAHVKCKSLPSVLLSNVRSFMNKKDELEASLVSYSVQIAC